MNETTAIERWQFVVAGVFALGFCAGIVGVFLPSLSDKNTVVLIVAISAGSALLTFALPRIASFKLGLEGVEAQLESVDGQLIDVDNKIDDLKKIQLQMALDLKRDLISKRFDVYGELWARMQCLAKYTDKPFTRNDATELWEELSDWYFSNNGGLFLTKRAREFYFALQDILGKVKDINDWQCENRPDNPEELFNKLLTKLPESNPIVKAYSKETRDPITMDAGQWRETCRKSLALELETLANAQQPATDVGDIIYSTIQQVSSVLRSNLANDIKSRFND